MPGLHDFLRLQEIHLPASTEQLLELHSTLATGPSNGTAVVGFFQEKHVQHGIRGEVLGMGSLYDIQLCTL